MNESLNNLINLQYVFWNIDKTLLVCVGVWFGLVLFGTIFIDEWAVDKVTGCL